MKIFYKTEILDFVLILQFLGHKYHKYWWNWLLSG